MVLLLVLFEFGFGTLCLGFALAWFDLLFACLCLRFVCFSFV